MTLMKKGMILGFALSLLICFPFAATAGILGTELAAEFAAAGSKTGDIYDVIVLINNPENSHPDGVLTRGELLTALMTRARISQQPVLEQIQAAEGADSARVVDYRSLWIVNAIALTADRSTILSISKNLAVKKVVLDKPIPLPKTWESTAIRSSSAYEWSLENMKIPEVAEQYGLDGSGVIVGHLDTGVDASHPDLEGKIVNWKDFTAEPSETPVDTNGHGTHTAGTIAGGSASGKQIGAAPGAKLVVGRVFATGSTTGEILLSGMQWIADPDGDPATDDAPAMCCNSWGGGDSPERRELYKQAIQTWLDAGVIPIFANGNSGPWKRTTGLPGGFLNVISVGATKKNNKIAFFSSRGPIKWDGIDRIKPDVSAPGSGVRSAKPGGGYTSMSGTSMACPNVTGLVALMKQAAPSLTTEFASQVLQETALDMGSAGKDNKYGAGVVNGLAAIEKLKEIMRLTE